MKYLIILTICLFLPSVNANSKTVIVTGKAVITSDITLAQAKHQALNQARSIAIEQAAGLNVYSSLMMKNALVVSEFVKTFSSGFLTEETIISWQGEWVKTKKHAELGLPVVTVKIKADVKVPHKSFFHNFALEASLIKTVFQNGDSVNIKIQTKEEMLILVVNYTSDNEIIPIYPFAADSQLKFSKNVSIELPGVEKDHFSIIVNNYPTHKQDTEAFIILGIGVNSTTASIPFHQLFKPGEKISYPAFFSKLLDLPLPWIAEKTLIYSVFSH